MCPLCLSTVTLAASGAVSGAGALGIAASRWRRWLRRSRERVRR
jgi:hypothetical protein